jgi:tRNA pseudouridine32 synthase / 23S rRNA pseudouridine746 synthase
VNHPKFDKIVTASQRGKACDLLVQATGLSKSAVKQAMNAGAVWLRRGKAKERRLRRATFEIRPQDQLAIYHDPSILSRKAAPAFCLEDHQHYSIWFKPAGLMTQGNRYGDHCALTRQVERFFKPARKVYLVHRLDRETAGLVLVCHHSEAAGRFSRMFRSREVKKGYVVGVRGDLRRHGQRGEITLPLGNREARTQYRWSAYDPKRDESEAQVEIITGRTHQIRRHFDMIGYPVVGDPRYGEGNKNRTGLKLFATSLAFTCPYRHHPIRIRIDPDRLPRTTP